MEGSTSNPAREYVSLADNQVDEANQITTNTAQLLETKKLTLICVVESISEFVNAEDSTIRSKAIGYLSAVLANLAKDFLTRQQIMVLTQFFCARAQDGGSISALTKLQSLSRFHSEMAAIVMTALGETFHDLRNLPQNRRYEIYELIDLLMRNHRATLRGMGDQSLVFIVGIVSGEKDPRNLMMVFSVLHVVMVEWDTLRHAEMLFESVFCYFPITFRPPPHDPYGITAQDLKDRLRQCIASNALFAPYVFPQLIDKLDSTSPSVKKDVIQTITSCAKSYGPSVISAYSISLWDSLKFEILSEQDKDIGNEALEALKAIGTALASRVSNLEPHDTLAKFVKPIIKELREHLEEPQHKQASGAARILNSIGQSSAAAFAAIVKAMFPFIISSYSDATVVANRRGLLDALLQILEAGRKYEGSHAVSDVAINALLNPFRDQIFTIISRALMGTSADELSFRMLALRCLQSSASYRHLFSDGELGLAVQYLNEILLAPGFRGRKNLSNAAAEALKDLSTSKPHLLVEITFPTLLAQLPISSTDENHEYLNALDALARIGGGGNLADTLIRRLFNKVDSLISPPMHPEYIRAILLTLHHILSEIGLQTAPSKVDYLQRCVKLIKKAAEDASNNTLTALNDTSNMTLLGSVTRLLLRSADLLDQQRISHQMYSLYQEEAPFMKPGMLQDASEAQRQTIYLSTWILAGIDPKISLPVSPEDLPNLANSLIEMAAAEPYTSIKHGIHQHIALLVNKFMPGDKINEISVVQWAYGSSSSTFKLSPESIQTLFWISRALIARLILVEQILDSLLKLLSRQDLGSAAANGFAMLLSPEAILNKQNGAIVRLLTKQRVLGICVPAILDIFHQANPAVRVNCLVALSGLIANVQDSISLIEVDGLLPLLMQSLELDDLKVKMATLKTLILVLKEEPQVLEGHLINLISRLQRILLEHTYETADLRHAALQCLRGIPQNYSDNKLMSCYKPVMSCVSSGLDDPKRDVRKEAVDCRTAWITVDQSDFAS